MNIELLQKRYGRRRKVWLLVGIDANVGLPTPTETWHADLFGENVTGGKGPRSSAFADFLGTLHVRALNTFGPSEVSSTIVRGPAWVRQIKRTTSWRELREGPDIASDHRPDVADLLAPDFWIERRQ
jgi:hypothetical protein